MNKTLCIVGLVAVLLGSMPAAAQMSDTDWIHQLRADIQADRQAIVTANLELTPAESEAFWPVYREYRADVQKVADRMQRLIQEYAAVYPNVTPEQAKAMVDDMLAIQHDEVKVRKKHVSKFRKVLPEVKVARFLQLENKLDAVVKIGLADAIPLM